jgi:hypothetical protein
MVPGTLTGELSGLAGLPRNATVVVERAAVLWYLCEEAMSRLGAEHPELARTFTALVLKGAYCHLSAGLRKALIDLVWGQLRNWISIVCSPRWRRGNEQRPRMLCRTRNEGMKKRNRKLKVAWLGQSHIFIGLSLLSFLDQWV